MLTAKNIHISEEVCQHLEELAGINHCNAGAFADDILRFWLNNRNFFAKYVVPDKRAVNIKLPERFKQAAIDEAKRRRIPLDDLIKSCLKPFLPENIARDIKSKRENNISLSPAVFDALKKECPQRAKLHCHFADDIVSLGLLEYKKRRKAVSN